MKTFLSGFLARCLFSSLLCASPCLSAQTKTASGPPAQAMPATAHTLIAVKVTGSKRFTQEEVATASGLPVGTIAHEEDFRKAARQLGETGAEFRVSDADKFVPAVFTDFVWFTDDELRQKVHERVPLFKGELPTNGRLPGQVSDVLQAVLVENNIPGTVEFLPNAGRGEQVGSIDYRVSGISIRIRHVEFSGAGPGELSLLQAAAEKLSDREFANDIMAAFIQHALLSIYHEHGYLKASCAQPQPKVVKPDGPDSDDNRTKRTIVDVVFPVTPGIQYKLLRWEWSGNKEIPSDNLQPLLHVKLGQPADTVRLEDDLRTVQELYASRGHVTASIKANAEFDDAAGTVAYQLVVDEGPVYRMGELEFRGIDNNLTARLRAAWKLRPGDVYDASYLKQFLPQARKLLPANLDWEVSPHVTALSRDKTVDVDLQYTAKAPR